MRKKEDQRQDPDFEDAEEVEDLFDELSSASD